MGAAPARDVERSRAGWCCVCGAQQKKRLRKAGEADEIETVQPEASQAQAKAKSQAELKKSLFGDDDDDDGAPLRSRLLHLTSPTRGGSQSSMRPSHEVMGFRVWVFARSPTARCT